MITLVAAVLVFFNDFYLRHCFFSDRLRLYLMLHNLLFP